MSHPQTIITRKTSAAVFLVLSVEPGGEAAVHDALGDLASRVHSVASRDPDAALAAVFGFGSAVWDRLFSGPRPASLHPFRALEGAVHRAPSTPGDLLVHLKSDRMDLCYELGRLVVERFGAAVQVVEEVHGFRYFDLRDLTGFVDGSENPTGADASAAITVGAEDLAFAGGSYVAVQRYVTDFDAWQQLPVHGQEAAIGRTKWDNVEFADAAKAPNSHIALNVVHDAAGNQLEILRDNMPYGQAGGHADRGTFFIAYSATPDVTETMLRNMFLGRGEATHDRLLDFTTPVTGTQFFVPTADFLDDPPPLPA